jgi:hypothetical protein
MEIARLRSLRTMTGQELGYFFVAETDALIEATAEQRAVIQERYPACEFEGVPGGVLSRK